MAAHCESIEVNCYCPVVSHSGLVSFEFFSFGRGAGMGKEEVMLSFYCVWWMWIRPQSLQRSACILQQEKIGSPRITKMHTTLGYNAIISLLVASPFFCLNASLVLGAASIVRPGGISISRGGFTSSLKFGSMYHSYFHLFVYLLLVY